MIVLLSATSQAGNPNSTDDESEGGGAADECSSVRWLRTGKTGYGFYRFDGVSEMCHCIIPSGFRPDLYRFVLIAEDNFPLPPVFVDSSRR